MRISDAIILHNERHRQRNISAGRKENEGFVNKSDIGGKIWTNQSNPRARMSNLITGKSKMIRIDWVGIICKLTGTDPNFLFRQRSDHDEDFNKLVK